MKVIKIQELIEELESQRDHCEVKELTVEDLLHIIKVYELEREPESPTPC